MEAGGAGDSSPDVSNSVHSVIISISEILEALKIVISARFTADLTTNSY